MGQEEIENKIVELEREIAILPEGSITKKKIKDKEYLTLLDLIEQVKNIVDEQKEEKYEIKENTKEDLRISNSYLRFG